MSKDETIREAAYHRWMQAGRPCCDGTRYWFEAEQEYEEQLRQKAMDDDEAIDEASQESFPASDSPATRIATSPLSAQKGHNVKKRAS